MNGTQGAPPGDFPPAVIRPVRPADLTALGDFFEGLSIQARYLRFFAPVTPSPSLLRLLSGGTGTVAAIVAVTRGVIIGHAMAADRSTQRGVQTTDIGVVVADTWQSQGVGSALMRALIAGAQERGVTSVTMDVLPGNRRVLAMITGHWPAARIDHVSAYDTIYLGLPRHQQHGRRHRTPVPSRAGACGQRAAGVV